MQSAPACLFTALALAGAMTTLASANLIANGSFETAAGSTPALWQAVGNLDLSAGQATTDGLLAVAFSLGNVPSNGSLAQTVATTPGATYEIAFDLGKYSANQPIEVARLAVDIFSAAPLPAADTGDLIAATVLDNTPGPGVSTPDATVYDSYVFSFVATSNSTSVRFLDLSDAPSSGGGFDAMLDNVTLTAVPEPVALLLLLMGFAGIKPRQR
ncbi:DUF642 domain-containing protein [Botrimarina hoheduenensis]|uniref:Uncharacterized protein n=1 Tax=Botrimarina hoheduenensis TaxID=2528000 RepID=A0A5C5VWE8_9BACT|nr:DUF642 domain-containing protein [Botrimarina hoheduenensis]TWT42700.1 hypothetical protein Pla111_26730 [Botrimarina hoheduenensis]